MLDTLRANSRSVLTYVLFGIIIVVFVVSFGPGAKGCTAADFRSTGYAAKVNGVAIPTAEVERIYRNAARQGAQDEYLRARIVRQLEDQELIYQEAEQHGLAMSDEQLSREIQRMAMFQVDGKFDVERYRQQAVFIAGSEGRFEQKIRRELVINRMVAAVAETVKVPEDEVKQTWLAENDKVKLAFVQFPTDPGELGVKPTEAEVSAFLAANAPKVEEYYNANKPRYTKLQTVHARQILLKLDKSASPSEQQAVEKKIRELSERAKKGEDFAQLARQYSEDPGSKEQGGEMKPFTRGIMMKEVDQVAFSVKPGEISAPFKSPNGWHLLKVDSIEQPEVTPLEKVRTEIARELAARDMSSKMARQQAEQALAKAKAGTPLSLQFPAADPKAQAQAHRTVHETELLAPRGDYIPPLGAVPGLGPDAAQRNAGDLLPKVYEGQGGLVVAMVKEHQRPDPAKFAEQKEQLTEAQRRVKTTQVEMAWIESLREKAKILDNPGALEFGPRQPLDMD